MLTAEGRVRELHLRVALRRQQLERRRLILLGGSGGILALSLLACLSAGGLSHAGGLPSPWTGTTMLLENAGGYVLTAVLAFMAGTIITAVLMRRRAKNMDTHGTEEETE